ncbi:MAG: radical SAM family heme chaperone HemW [Candidatus Omnitrophica bacterium]|jgi:oxygen-independent coproporphyrinogen-3 oxidase|nr:radical SAM family heme chaperone HemW [Candidatus Omnitrophota bacterium]
MTSLYIHIPFCAKKCLYCDFYSIGYEKELAQAYIKTISRQIKLLNEKFYTIYIGGGTPTSLDIPLLHELLKALSSISKKCNEFTIEANPETLSQEKIKLLRGSGVNRISIGVQSLNDKKLKALGRIHNSGRALESIRLAEKNGFSNINIDLIFGVWSETVADWRDELRAAVKLPVKHISCYSLTYERHTQLFKNVKNKVVVPLPDSICARMYKLTMDYLPKQKFRQYEISNFAKRGFECKHNLNYWENNSYMGVGVSAVSFINGVREKNISGIKEYIRKMQKGKSVVCSTEKLSAKKAALETAAIKIRTIDGIDFGWFRKRTGFDFMALEKGAIKMLVKEKLLKYRITNKQPKAVSVTEKGLLFCDSISSQLL